LESLRLKEEEHMTKRSIGRGFAVALAAVIAAGSAALAQPANAATSAGSTRQVTTAAESGGGPGAAPRHGAGPSQTGPRAHQDGACDLKPDGNGDFCLYGRANRNASYSDFYDADDNLWDNYFLSPGEGQGVVVADQSESYWNRDQRCGLWVYTETQYSGDGMYIPPRWHGNFNATFVNNVESLRWVC